jgi:hypothetical protein
LCIFEVWKYFNDETIIKTSISRFVCKSSFSFLFLFKTMLCFSNCLLYYFEMILKSPPRALGVNSISFKSSLNYLSIFIYLFILVLNILICTMVVDIKTKATFNFWFQEQYVNPRIPLYFFIEIYINKHIIINSSMVVQSIAKH